MSLTKTTYRMNSSSSFSVLDYGAVGDGTTDDTAAFQAALTAATASHAECYIPHTDGGYKITDTLTVQCDVVCNGYLLARFSTGTRPVLEVNMTSSSPFTVVKGNVIKGIRILGNISQINGNVYGIRLNDYGHVLKDCWIEEVDVAYVVRGFNMDILTCVGYSNNKHISSYARSANTQANTLRVIGGSYAGAAVNAVVIGDTSWADAWSTSEAYGVNILLEGFNTDLSTVLVDKTHGIKISNVYFEYSTTGDYGIILGSSGSDGANRNVIIEACTFQNMRFPIYCAAGIDRLHVGPCYTKNHVVSFLRLASEAYSVTVDQQLAVSSDVAQFVQFSFPNSSSIGQVDFNWFTIQEQERAAGTLQGTILNGIQRTNYTPAIWYPNGVLKTAGTVTTNTNAGGVYHATPYTGVAGTMAGNIITCTNTSQSYEFNGGDAVVVSASGSATFIKSIDYLTGKITVNGSTASGATTIGQIGPTLSTYIINSNSQLAIDGLSSANTSAIFATNNPATPAVTVQTLWNKQTSGDNGFIDFYTEASATIRGSIDYNRSGNVARYNTTSDALYKEIVGNAPFNKSKEILSNTAIKEYIWNDDESRKVQIGVIAQEVYNSGFEGAVSVGGDYTVIDEKGNEEIKYKSWGVDKTAWTFHLINGWQSHQEEIDSLKLKIAELTARIDAL